MYSQGLAALQKNGTYLPYNYHFLSLLFFFNFFFFCFTFKIKNLLKKAYKVYGRGIQEVN